MESLWVAKTGLEAQQTRMTVVSQNLANVNTTGYKRQRAMFEDLLYQNVVQGGGLTSQQTEAPTGLNLGTGVRVVATDRQFSQGNIVTTGNQLDVAINGRGFFEILLPDGTQAYTRDGTFQINADGQLVTSSGYTVQPAITIPAGRVRRHDRRRRHVSAMPPGQSDAGPGRHAAAHGLRESGRPAAARREPVRRDSSRAARRSPARRA